MRNLIKNTKGMFTGIIEKIGHIAEIESRGNNLGFWISSEISNELKVDQSLSHNGVCLTVEATGPGRHKVTAVKETLDKTNLDDLSVGDLVNLERCMQMNGRLDGHIVQGHVDAIALCIGKHDLDGSWEFEFEYPAEFASLLIEKGSVCINGISLTAFNVTKNVFWVTIIPYTYEHTNMHALQVGQTVNIEFDMLGKYINRIMKLNSKV